MTKKYISYTREMIAENKKRRTPYTPKTPLKTKDGKEYISYTREMIAENNKMRVLKPASRELKPLYIGGSENQSWQGGPINREQLRDGLREALMNVNVMSVARDGDEDIKDTVYVLNMNTPPPSSYETEAVINPLIREILSEDKDLAIQVQQRIRDQITAEDQTINMSSGDATITEDIRPDYGVASNVRSDIQEYKPWMPKIDRPIRSDIQEYKPWMPKIDRPITSDTQKFKPWAPTQEWDRPIRADTQKLNEDVNGYMLRVDEPTCSKENLLHPKWYFGFWRDSYIEFEGTKGMGIDTVIKFTFFSNDYRSTSFEYKIYKGTFEKHKIFFAQYYKSDDYANPDDPDPDPSLKDLPVIGSHSQINEIGGSKKKDPASGWLVVWNSNIWKCQYLNKGIKRYMNPDLFDHVKMKRSRADFNLTKMKIVLNGVKIFDKDYGHPGYSLASHGGYLIFDVQSYRHNSLLYGNDYNSCPRIPNGYKKTKIIESSLLRDFSHQLGKSWNPKYCRKAEWNKNGEWRLGPEAWCADSSSYYIKKAMPNFDAKPALSKMTKWFAEKGLYIGPNQIGSNRCNYSQLGDKVKPGYFLTIRNGFHGELFLYWLESPFHLVNYPGDPHGKDFFKGNSPRNPITVNDLEDLTDLTDGWIKKLKSPSDNPSPKPGAFYAVNRINYFLAINGNSGNRIDLNVGAIINFDGISITPPAQELLFLKSNTPKSLLKDKSSQAMIWCKNRPYDYKRVLKELWPLYTGGVIYEDGFGITTSEKIPRVGVIRK